MTEMLMRKLREIKIHKMSNRLFYLLLCITMLSCSSREIKKKKIKSEVAAPASKIATIILEKGKLSSSLQIPGELIAYQQVDLYAKVNSFVRRLYVDVGSEVKAGQLLASMEAPEINSQLSGAESRLQSSQAIYMASKANYDRLLETSKTPGTISPNDLDMAEARQKSDFAQWQSAKAAHKEININKGYLEIRAPFSGIITARNVSAGAYVGPSGKGSEMPLFTLQEQQHLRLSVAIPEAYTGYLEKKNKVSFTVRSMPDQEFSATITRRAGALDTRLRSEKVEMDVNNQNKKLLPGMVAEISILLPGQDSTFVIPKTALVNAAERVFVIRVKEGKAQWVSVKKGREANNKMEIYAELSVGDTLVQNANEEIRDETLIQQ
jgi:membrane fusion protein (multidrug efflux system)